MTFLQTMLKGYTQLRYNLQSLWKSKNVIKIHCTKLPYYPRGQSDYSFLIAYICFFRTLFLMFAHWAKIKQTETGILELQKLFFCILIIKVFQKINFLPKKEMRLLDPRSFYLPDEFQQNTERICFSGSR